MDNHPIHRYQTQVIWTGNQGQGTSSYRAYTRSHEIMIEGKPTIFGSSDVAFRGDASKHNPEELLVASLSACHMLWYLHLCADAAVIVVDYCDRAIGIMIETVDGSGRFSEVLLQPIVTIATSSDPNQATQLHEKAHQFCFIANSMNFPVRCKPAIHIKQS